MRSKKHFRQNNKTLKNRITPTEKKNETKT